MGEGLLSYEPADMTWVLPGQTHVRPHLVYQECCHQSEVASVIRHEVTPCHLLASSLGREQNPSRIHVHDLECSLVILDRSSWYSSHVPHGTAPLGTPNNLRGP